MAKTKKAESKKINTPRLLAHFIAIIGVIFVLFIYWPVGLLLIAAAAYMYSKSGINLKK